MTNRPCEEICCIETVIRQVSHEMEKGAICEACLIFKAEQVFLYEFVL